VPESSKRKQAAYTPPSGTGGLSTGAGAGRDRAPKPSPRWWVPTLLGIMVLGLLWIVVFYLSGTQQLPVPQLGAWNLGVGFALIIVGFAMTTRWR